MSAHLQHRCGGMLHPQPVAIRNEDGGLVFQFLVPGSVCDRCHEELIDRNVARGIERNQTPVIWYAGNLHASRIQTIDLGRVMSSFVVAR